MNAVPSAGNWLRGVAPLVAALAGIFVTVSLGNWQLRRADQKIALAAQAQIVQRETPRPITAADITRGDVPLPARIRVHGHFLSQFTVWLDNRALDSRPGFRVVAPLVVAPGVAVLVDRGWAPRDPIERTRLPAIDQPAADVDLEGLTLPEFSRRFALGGAPSGTLPAIWQNLDLAAFRRASGLDVAGFVIQQTGADGGGLRRDLPVPDYGVDMHRGYAVQWYALASVIAILLAWFYVRPRLRARRDAR